jgi:hypothetical protein
MGCIKDYYPDESELKTGTLVVQAHLTGITGEQSVRISRSATLVYPEFDPVSGCHVEVESLSGDSRGFEEKDQGIYTGNFDPHFFKSGDSYRLSLITPDGEHYLSEYEPLYPSTQIDSLYFLKEEQGTRDPENTEEGIQFYIDFKIEKNLGRYLRWQLIETYEIHNPENDAWIFDVDRRLKELSADESWRTCWITNEIEDIYTQDLGNVEGETYRKRPLNYVNTSTRRLQIKYSLLVRQLSMSKSSFTYWDELAKNMQSNGDLFESQPALTPGNICNVHDEQELVIGYFSMSGVSEARVFVSDIPGLKVAKDPAYCAPGVYPDYLQMFRVEYLPVYLAEEYVDGVRNYGEVHKYCVDCREYKGSSHVKPDFW